MPSTLVLPDECLYGNFSTSSHSETPICLPHPLEAHTGLDGPGNWSFLNNPMPYNFLSQESQLLSTDRSCTYIYTLQDDRSLVAIRSPFLWSAGLYTTTALHMELSVGLVGYRYFRVPTKRTFSTQKLKLSVRVCFRHIWT
jgi:hypothetical protein